MDDLRQLAPEAATATRAEDPPAPKRLSEELQSVVELFEQGSLSVQVLIETMRGRAYTLLLILLSAPFCQPVALPGVSTPFGAVIALIGLRLALGQEPWLPTRLLQVSLHANLFLRVIQGIQKGAKLLEVLLRPRLPYLIEHQAAGRILGLLIFSSGLLLLLPLPVPFSNLLPAMVVFLAACARLERDGLAAVASLATFGITLIFFVGIFAGSAAALSHLTAWLHGAFAGD